METRHMKILMLTTGMDIGGAETHIAELCRGLVRKGYDVGVASSGGLYANSLKDEGVPQYTLPLNRKDPVSLIRCAAGIRKIVEEGGYNIVHAHARIPAMLCGILQKRMGFRFVTTLHAHFKVNAFFRAVSHWGEHTVSISSDLTEYIKEEYGVQAENITTTVNGINMERFSPDAADSGKTALTAKELGLNPGSRRIVFASRLDEDCSLGAEILIRILPELRRRFGGVELIIVGGGGDYKRIKKLSEDANREIGENAVHVTGRRLDVDRIIALADVFVGVSRAALEAMAEGKPVVLAGNEGWLGSFTKDKTETAVETNFCCRGCEIPNDELMLSDVSGLLSMIESSPEDIAEMSDYNRSVIAENYSIERMCSDYVKVYENLPPPTVFSRPDAIISGYFGYGNSGDDTALDCLTAAIRREYPEAKLSVLCRDPEKFGKAHCLHGIGRYNILKTVRELRSAKLLISGGGSLLQNVTSTRSLRYYAGIIRLARMCGTKVFICANGVGPINGRAGRRIAARAAAAADRISVRDPVSKETMISLGVPAEKVLVTADPAFRLALDPMADVTELRKSIGMRDGERYFAVSVRSAVCSGDREREICRACRDIYLNLGLTPVFVSMQESEDMKLCGRIAGETCGEALIVPHVSPEYLCSIVEGMELVLSMRLHLVIYAAAAGTPAVGIAVDPKLEAAAGVLGGAELVPGNFTAEELLDAAEKALSADAGELHRIALDQAELAAEDAAAAVDMMRT